MKIPLKGVNHFSMHDAFPPFLFRLKAAANRSGRYSHKARFFSSRSSPISATQTTKSAARSANFHKRIFLKRTWKIWSCRLAKDPVPIDGVFGTRLICSSRFWLFLSGKHILSISKQGFFGVQPNKFPPFATFLLSYSSTQN